MTFDWDLNHLGLARVLVGSISDIGEIKDEDVQGDVDNSLLPEMRQ